MRESLLIRTALEVEAIRRVTQINDVALMATLEENLKAQAAALAASDLAFFYDLDEALHAHHFQRCSRRVRYVCWTPPARRSTAAADRAAGGRTSRGDARRAPPSGRRDRLAGPRVRRRRDARPPFMVARTVERALIEIEAKGG